MREEWRNATKREWLAFRAGEYLEYLLDDSNESDRMIKIFTVLNYQLTPSQQVDEYDMHRYWHVLSYHLDALVTNHQHKTNSNSNHSSDSDEGVHQAARDLLRQMRTVYDEVVSSYKYRIRLFNAVNDKLEQCRTRDCQHRHRLVTRHMLFNPPQYNYKDVYTETILNTQSMLRDALINHHPTCLKEECRYLTYDNTTDDPLLDTFPLLHVAMQCLNHTHVTCRLHRHWTSSVSPVSL